MKPTEANRRASGTMLPMKSATTHHLVFQKLTHSAYANLFPNANGHADQNLQRRRDDAERNADHDGAVSCRVEDRHDVDRQVFEP